MQDNLKEIKGTLARTSERKNTILYKHAKREREEKLLERLGVSKLPTNPVEVTDPTVVKHVLFEIKKDIGTKTAKLRNPTFFSLEKDGEKVIRQKNEEINSLIAKKKQWERRLAFLNHEPFLNTTHKKFFFGCAKQLPEAVELGKEALHSNAEEEDETASDRSEQHDEEDDEKDGQFSASAQYAEAIRKLFSQDLDKQLIGIEKQQEQRERAKAKEGSRNEKSFSQEENLGLILSFWSGDKLNLPEEEQYKSDIMNARKRALREKIEATRKRLV